MTDAATGRPVAGVIVGAQLIEYRKRILGGWGDAMTDDQGRFLIDGLEPGVYNVLFQRVRGPCRGHGPGRGGVRVRAGADTPADLTVDRGPALARRRDRPGDRPARARILGRLLRPGTAPIRGGRPSRAGPTNRAVSRSTSLPASSMSTSWMAAHSAA